jgi:hypothetical protein
MRSDEFTDETSPLQNCSRPMHPVGPAGQALLALAMLGAVALKQTSRVDSNSL